MPFEIPDSWEWVRLEDYVSKVTDFVASGSFASLRENVTYYKEENYAILVRTADFGSNFNKDLVYTDKHGYEFLENSNLVGGELILPNIGASIGKVFIVPKLSKRMTLGPNSILIRTLEEDMTIYLYYSFLSLWGYNLLHDISSATAQGKFNKTDLKNVILPIPPYFEQKRIIKAVKDWFSQIDNIDKDIADIQDAIKQTKLKVLDLAIHGKLVPQDPNDEPAIELLRRINPHFIPCDTSHYENLPGGWCICLLKDVAKTISSREFQVLQSEILKNGKYPVISQSANYIEGYNNDEKKLLHHSSPIVIFGDHTRIVKYVDFDFIVGADGVKILLPSFDAKYFYYLVIFAAENIDNRGYGRHFSYLSKFPMLFPPFEEQKRIVKKIDEIFETIDKITAEL